MNIKRNINFQLENRTKNGVLISENVPIRIRITFLGNRVELFAGIRVDRNKWNEKKQRVKNSTYNHQGESAADINVKLSEYEKEIQSIFKRFEVLGVLPTKDDIKFGFSSIFSNRNYQAKKDFFGCFDEFVSDSGRLKNWTDATYEKFATVKKHLTDFNSKISFPYLDDDGLTSYVEYLRDKLEMRNSTIEKQISFLKWFLKWAKAKGYNSNLAYELFKPKLKATKKKIIFLTQEEIQKIKDYEIPCQKLYLERVRDVFLFSIYSGLRYSDVKNLKRSDLKKDFFEVTTIKTDDSLIIEFNKYSKEILDKYHDIPFKDDKALPVISNQKMNEYIRELAKLAEINEPIRQTHYKGNERIDEVSPKHELLATHCGRRTFICTALSLGIPINVIMKWTGHSDYKSMKPYIDIADDIKAKAMKKFDTI